MEVLEKAEQLKNELDSLRPLDAEAEARIMQKFRLDWNYHSNKLEGNSYTYGETKMLLLTGNTAGGKPVKDQEEIIGHNAAIDYIIDAVAEKNPLTEVFIRDLHKMILVKDRWVEAKTSDGKPTKRLVKVGVYKTEPNHVETETGMFYFAEPIETPAKMEELIEWFREKTELTETNPIILAAEFHYRFILIHPFGDGNGRLARLLMNFILMRSGYPPVIVKNEDKDNYIAALSQADFHILEPFVEYITYNLVHSLELMIKGAKGEDIDEPEDLDKELALLERKIRSAGRKVEIIKSIESVLKVYEHSIVPLFKKFIETCQKFDRFYLEKGITIIIDDAGSRECNSKHDVINSIRESLEITPRSRIELRYIHEAFNQNDLGDFNFESEILVGFHITRYRISGGLNYKKLERNPSEAAKDGIIYEKLYSERLSKEEIGKIIKLKFNQHKEFLDEKHGENESRLKLHEFLTD
jgi:Fic family protein